MTSFSSQYEQKALDSIHEKSHKGKQLEEVIVQTGRVSDEELDLISETFSRVEPTELAVHMGESGKGNDLAILNKVINLAGNVYFVAFQSGRGYFIMRGDDVIVSDGLATAKHHETDNDRHIILAALLYSIYCFDEPSYNRLVEKVEELAENIPIR